MDPLPHPPFHPIIQQRTKTPPFLKMGHAFSSHHPSFITNDYQYQTGKLAQSEVQKYRSFEEDGDQKLFIEERCIETVDECKEMKSRYDECVERIEGQGMQLRSRGSPLL